MSHFPLLPLRDIVVFPGQVVPLFVGRDKSVAALEAAMEADKDIFLLTQLDQGTDDPARDDLYEVGVVAQVLQLLKLPDGTVRVLVEGQARGRLLGMSESDGHVVAQVDPIEEEAADGNEVAAMMQSALDQFADYAKQNKKLPDDIEDELGGIEDAGRLADAIAAALAAKVATKQQLLTETDPVKRLEMVFSVMEGELSVLQVERKIRGRVKRQMEKTQREYYLNEQLKAIQSELGGSDGEEANEVAELQEKIDKLKLSKEAKAKATSELKKLKTM
ncbi:MAG TPA: LON peptidase substrate-binding domain-containing protein, partial [Croceibacterium sp.]|nr:LON peptidase substrate-binding domain-containing protein [Croceibacterium sp.]